MSNMVSGNIKKLRLQKGISQDRLSKEADLALNTIVKIETEEKSNPTVDTLKKISKGLNISLHSIFVLPLKSLRELEEKRLLKLSKGFGGWLPSGTKIETGLNKLVLKRLELTNDGKAVRLICKNGATGYIRSEDTNLLNEIRNVLKNLKGKTISEIYSKKVIAYE